MIGGGLPTYREARDAPPAARAAATPQMPAGRAIWLDPTAAARRASLQEKFASL
jgi:hypothetical protein